MVLLAVIVENNWNIFFSIVFGLFILKFKKYMFRFVKVRIVKFRESEREVYAVEWISFDGGI